MDRRIPKGCVVRPLGSHPISSIRDTLRLAEAADVDDRTALRWLANMPVLAACAERLTRALRDFEAAR